MKTFILFLCLYLCSAISINEIIQDNEANKLVISNIIKENIKLLNDLNSDNYEHMKLIKDINLYKLSRFYRLNIAMIKRAENDFYRHLTEAVEFNNEQTGLYGDREWTLDSSNIKTTILNRDNIYNTVSIIKGRTMTTFDFIIDNYKSMSR